MEIRTVCYDLLKSLIIPVVTSIITAYMINRRLAHKFYNRAPCPPEIVKCTCRKGIPINSLLSSNHTCEKKYFFEFYAEDDDENKNINIANGTVLSYDFDDAVEMVVTVLLITNNSDQTCILKDFVFPNKIRSNITLIGEHKHIHKNERFIICFPSINIAPKSISFDCGGYAYEPSLSGTDGTLPNAPKRIKKAKKNIHRKIYK